MTGYIALVTPQYLPPIVAFIAYREGEYYTVSKRGLGTLGFIRQASISPVSLMNHFQCGSAILINGPKTLKLHITEISKNKQPPLCFCLYNRMVIL
jgi:hypothetical protein